jgi:hypothetical protein
MRSTYPLSATDEVGAAVPSVSNRSAGVSKPGEVRRPMVRASQTDPSKRGVQAHIDAGHRKERPSRLPDAVYDEIADVLIAEAERMASSRPSPRAARR